MKIKVARRHIRDGLKQSYTDCPIGLAIQEQLGVSSYSLRVTGEKITLGTMKFPCPTRAARFIDAFDNERRVKPFVFILS